VRSARLRCDPRIYKNCYAVGIPHSEHRVGIRWALAIGALLPDPGLKLECFRQITPAVLEGAGRLIDGGRVAVEIEPSRRDLFIDCTVERERGTGRAVVAGDHTRLFSLERDGRPVPGVAPASGKPTVSLRARLAAMSFEELIALAEGVSGAGEEALHKGCALNAAIAAHGLSLFPRSFVDMQREDPLTRASRRVCAGVYARMWGEDFPVMTLAGSGNKGIVCAVPLQAWGQESGKTPHQIAQALALACLVTSATTHHLGALSAVCGCSNAAGIGLAAGLCLLEGGGSREISLAIHNMVGNVTGMICDGAKIGCALKTMTAVDAAFRATRLALAGVGIPESDGIVGRDGQESLRNLGRIANRGMISADAEILAIMGEKLNPSR
jgi:L-cysteine desulfidase